MSDGSDPRVFFAAERTLLAWIRTGLAASGTVANAAAASSRVHPRMLRNSGLMVSLT